jgi:hypothetical protein
VSGLFFFRRPSGKAVVRINLGKKSGERQEKAGF